MLDHKTAQYTAPSVAARVVEWFNNGNGTVVVVENLDALASASIQYQDSDDGANWTTVTGTAATVNPGLSNIQIVASARARLALHAGGNVKLNIHVIRQVNGAPNSLGVA